MPEEKQRAKPTGKLDPKVVADIRAMRAKQDSEGRPLHSHKAVADAYGTTPGIVSQICRNLSYVDPDYTPVNDGPDVTRALSDRSKEKAAREAKKAKEEAKA